MFSYLKNFFALVTANSISNVLAIITFPVLYKKIGNELYGNRIFIISIFSILSVIQTLGTDTLIARDIAAKRLGAKNIIRKFIGIKITLTFLLIFFITVQYFISIPESQNYRLFIYYTIPLLLLNIFSFENLLMGIEEFKLASILRLFIQVIHSLTVLFIINEPNDIYYVINANILSSAAASFWAWVVLIKIGYSVTPIFNLKDSLNIIKKSIKYFYSSICGVTYTRVGAILTKIFLSEYWMGIYAAAMRLFEIIIEFAYIIYKPLMPKIIQMIEHNGEYNKIVSLVFKLCILNYIPIIVGFISIGDKLIIYFFDESIVKEINLYYYFLPSIFIFPMTSFTSSLLVGFNMHNNYFYSTVLGAICSIILNILLGHFFGVYGLAVSYSLSSLFMLGYNFIVLKNNFQRFNYKEILGILFCLFTSLFIINTFSFMFNNFLIVILLSILFYMPVVYFYLKADFEIIYNSRI